MEGLESIFILEAKPLASLVLLIHVCDSNRPAGVAAVWTNCCYTCDALTTLDKLAVPVPAWPLPLPCGPLLLLTAIL